MEKESLLKTPAIISLANFQIFKFCCYIQGSHLIGYLWVSLIIDQSECLICFFLCTELTLFCTELPENYIYLNQSELSNFSTYIIRSEIIRVISKSNGCAASSQRVPFKVTSMISDQNSTTQSSITALVHSFWKRRIQSLKYGIFQ